MKSWRAFGNSDYLGSTYFGKNNFFYIKKQTIFQKKILDPLKDRGMILFLLGIESNVRESGCEMWMSVLLDILNFTEKMLEESEVT